jgi:hypothetical protein
MQEHARENICQGNRIEAHVKAVKILVLLWGINESFGWISMRLKGATN